MVRELTVLAVLGATFFACGEPATAAVARPAGAGAVPVRPDRLSDAERAALDNLLGHSGLKVQLESLSAGVRVQFLRGRGRLSGEDRVTIDRIVSERFAAEALYARIEREFERNFDGRKLAEALEWYGSPLGKRITGLELAALVGGAHASELENIRPTSRRLELLQRLDVGGGASETTVDVTLVIVRNMVRAFQPVLPTAVRLSRDQLEDNIAQVRSRMLDQIRQACLVTMLFAYRELSDEELDRYVQFVDSESGQWYMSLMNSALLTAVDRAAEATAAELETAVPQFVGDRR
jgi:hypothetical protein